MLCKTCLHEKLNIWFPVCRYGLKWKQLYELFDKKKDALERELTDEKRKLEEQIEYAKYEHDTEMLREREFLYNLKKNYI